MSNYKIIFQYDGTKYNGFQRQGNTDNTIQAKIENILTKLSGTPIEISASGRTDAGVHAKAQVANFHLTTNLSEQELLVYLNTYLPQDITILSLKKVPNRFHSRLNATSKTYSYHIDTNPKPDVFNIKYSMHHPDSLDIDLMKQASLNLLGEHDFKSFCSLKKTKKSTVRTIFTIDFFIENNQLIISYTANGFLYNMVRIITGTLIQVGEKKISPEEITYILAMKDRNLSGPTVPAKGLFLEKVEYNSIMC